MKPYKHSSERISGRNTGMAIPVVLGFIFVAMIFGSTMIFVSRARVADTKRNFNRLQHMHCTRMGINEALAVIKPMTLSEIITTRGENWSLIVPEQKFGKAISWCEVRIERKGKDELAISSTGFWKEGKAGPIKRICMCILRYMEERHPDKYGKDRIHGEWKALKFREDRKDQSD